jgi:hypothetical protein
MLIVAAFLFIIMLDVIKLSVGRRPVCTVVEHLTQNPNIKGFNPAIVKGKENMTKKMF